MGRGHLLRLPRRELPRKPLFESPCRRGSLNGQFGVSVPALEALGEGRCPKAASHVRVKRYGQGRAANRKPPPRASAEQHRDTDRHTDRLQP